MNNLIQQYVSFPNGFTLGKWSSSYCEVCGDGTHAKGPRGGWLITDNVVFFHCFNCGAEGNFCPTREKPFSKNMYHIFSCYKFNMKHLINICKFDNSIQHTTVSHGVSTVTIPDNFVPLKSLSPTNYQYIRTSNFLYKNYKLSIDDYDFYITNKTIESVYDDRVIIPTFYQKRIVYYQARTLVNHKLKYYSNVSYRNILFNMDQLNKEYHKPLFVTEGAFDALHLNGVATITNNITSQQVQLLRECKRRVIIVPDFNSDSQKLAIKLVDMLNCEIALPDIPNCKDVSESIVKYGKLYTLHKLSTSIYSGKSGIIKMRLISNYK